MIRRIGISLFVFLCLINSATAQTSKQSLRVQVGVAGGVSANKVLFNPVVDQKLLLAPSSGLIVRVNEESTGTLKVGLQAEASYIRLGWEEKFDEKPDNAYRRTFDCVTIPLLTHIKIRQRGLYAFLNLGPQFGFIIAEKTVKQGSDFTELQQRRYAQGLHGRFEWGLAGGPGFGFDAGRLGAFELEGRLYYGFHDLLNNRQQDPHGRSSNLTLGVKLNYLFGL
ncbi:porin family protein [Porphyromonas gingivalis]|uniref:porin family protein n=1 Tax=Porphyromonas gingivalis TaxID=837 RepID=UPI001B8D67A5|nr:porin family protein [Porphyromonas gingivalis]QUI89468.1 PorT family protein [Porphyromonas gingivalis]QUI91413.1 PorT family protein [Porphyromonas gingivalis]